MPENHAVTELYNKMLAEQNSFKDWLLGQSPQEILNHATEYATKEDILSVMQTAELTETQAKALLTSPTPLEDIWKTFDKSEIMTDENIRDCLTSRASVILLGSDSPKDIPVYLQNASFAIKHNELDVFRASNKANMDCCDAIENGISEHYNNNRLDTSFAKDLIDTYGMERVQSVVAGTIQQMDWDGRISPENKAWAKSVALPHDPWRITQSHPGLVNLFCNKVRQIQKEQQQEKKPSVLGKLSEPIPKPDVTPKTKSPER